jgi:hypothetical protein
VVAAVAVVIGAERPRRTKPPEVAATGEPGPLREART